MKETLNTAVNNTKSAIEKPVDGLKITMDNAVENTKYIDGVLKTIDKHNFKLASHNTMSYLTPKNWIYRLIAFTARCQSKTIYEQIEKYNVELVDLRFKFNDKGQVSFAHGAIKYKGGLEIITEVLEYLNSYENFPVRVLLENKPGDKDQEFIAWCKYIEETYTNIEFFGGRNKWNWDELYKFKNKHPKVLDKYSSCNTNEPGKPQTGTYLDDLCPILYAKKNNKKNIENGTDKDYLMIDFVEIR